MRTISPNFQTNVYKLAPRKPSAQPNFGCGAGCEVIAGVTLYLTKGCFKKVEQCDKYLAEHGFGNEEAPKPATGTKKTKATTAHLPKEHTKASSSSRTEPTFSARNPFAVL